MTEVNISEEREMLSTPAPLMSRADVSEVTPDAPFTLTLDIKFRYSNVHPSMVVDTFEEEEEEKEDGEVLRIDACMFTGVAADVEVMLREWRRSSPDV